MTVALKKFAEVQIYSQGNVYLEWDEPGLFLLILLGKIFKSFDAKYNGGVLCWNAKNLHIFLIVWGLKKPCKQNPTSTDNGST